MGKKIIIKNADFSNVAIQFDINDLQFEWTNTYYSAGSITQSSGNFDSPEPISLSIVRGYQLNIIDGYIIRLVAVKDDGSFVRSSEQVSGKIDIATKITELSAEANKFSFNLSKSNSGILTEEDRKNFYSWVV